MEILKAIKGENEHLLNYFDVLVDTHELCVISELIKGKTLEDWLVDKRKNEKYINESLVRFIFR